jgi:hypothetical protein
MRRQVGLLLAALALTSGCSAPRFPIFETNPPDREFPPAQGYALGQRPDFGFIFKDMSCFNDVLDTFDGTYSTLIKEDPPEYVTVSMPLSDEQMQTVFDKMIEINFFGYPDVFAFPVPPDGSMIIEAPAASYAILVRNGERRKSVEWVDDIVGPSDQPAVHLRGLLGMIQQMIQEHPAYRQVPPRTFGCA